ncbi:MAG: NAD kinase [Saprospiraceae bacterium]|nr:NAD kinase [Saprospiraceae bacterium]
MKVALYSRVFKSDDLPVLETLTHALDQQGISYCLVQELVEELHEHGFDTTGRETVSSHQELLASKVEAFICLGGDGTFLNALTLVRDSGIPLIGINLGRLGFLASLEQSQIQQAVSDFVSGRYDIEERVLLQLDSDQDLFGDCPYALNDFTILKRDTSSMITIDAYMNGDFMNTYWADGLIVATPTGSTGYSLSCGGPIVFPGSGNFVISPVAPHNLGVRPIVIPDKSVLSFEVKGRTDSFLCTMDSRFATITPEDQIAIRLAPFALRLIQFHSYSFLSTMREKLAWGRDLRN